MIRRLLRRPLVLALAAGLLALGATVPALRGIAARTNIGDGTVWTCTMHPSVRVRGPGRCPDCGMELVADSPQAAITPVDRRPVLLDGRRQQLIGVRTARVTRGELIRTLRATGSVGYDETRLADVNLKVEGWVREVYGRYVGQRVRRGEPLFSVYSPELDAVLSNLLTALNARKQGRGTAADPSYADRIVDAPRDRLERWDVSETELRQVERSGVVPRAVVFRSPIDGVIVEKAVIRGSHVQPGQTLYKIADLSVVWLEADFYESDLALLEENLPADISLDAYPGAVFKGRIVSMRPYVSEDTRTVAARIEIADARQRLKPGMWAHVDVSATVGEGLIIPADALVDSGRRQIVFVAEGNGYFEPREVTTGGSGKDGVLILGGLREREEVATRATFFLDSESRIAAALQSYEEPGSSSPAPAGDAYGIEMEIDPDPPRVGQHVIRVRLVDSDARPVTDATIDIRLSMPPMPAMNMPAMAADVRLAHVNGGIYSGPATLQMRGRWDVSITARRQGRIVASTHTALIVR